MLYDSGLPEIRAIVPMADGTVYAAALGGSVAGGRRPPPRPRRAGRRRRSHGHRPVTVEAQSSEIKPPEPKQGSAATAAPAPPAPRKEPALVEMSGVDKSAVYRINPDNTVETLWSSKDENVTIYWPWSTSCFPRT